jgi:hypothetical protein
MAKSLAERGPKMKDVWLLNQLDQGRLVVRGKLDEDSRRTKRPSVKVHLLTAHSDDDGNVYGGVTYCCDYRGVPDPLNMMEVLSTSRRGEAFEWTGSIIHNVRLIGNMEWRAHEEFVVYFQPKVGFESTLLRPEDVYLASHFARIHGMVAQLIQATGPEPERTFLHTLAHRIDGLIHRAIPAQYQ